MSAAVLRYTAVVGVVVAGMLAAAGPAGACDVTKVARAHKDPSRIGRAPLIVGDSTMLLATPYLGAHGIEADARGCRQLDDGIDLLAARRRAGMLPKVAVLALGSNGSIGAAQIRRALRITGSSRVLGLVTPSRTGSGSADAMRRAARRHPERVVLIDWFGFSRGRAGVFAGDGLHVSDRGARAFAGFVRRRLAPFYPPRSLGVPVTATGAKPCGRAGRLDVLVVRGADRVSCLRARRLARARALAGIAGWRYYDWHRSGRRPWTGVYVRADRRIIVATRRMPR